MKGKNLFNSEFSKNVITLVTGTSIAQAIPIAISPILTRIYTPEDFGIYTLFLAITTVIGAISCGRYELAIMLPEKDEDAINLFALGLFLTTVISLVTLFVIVLFKDQILLLLNNDEIGNWLYFVPLVTFSVGLFNLLNYFNIRIKKYKDLAKSTVIKSLVLAVFQLIVGFVTKGFAGLIVGQILSQISANLKLLKNIIKDKLLLAKISKENIKEQAKRYKKFPLFSVWGIMANTLSTQLTSILMSSLHTLSTLGIYALVQRVLGMPATLIGGSISQVFFQEATIEKQKTGKTIKSFSKTLKRLVFIGAPTFILIFFIIEELFAFVFGEEWRIGGTYAQILIPLFFIRFLSSTLSPILTIFEKQKYELYINVILLVSSVVSILIFKDFIFFLSFYSGIMSLNYLIFLSYYYKLSKQ